jgi:uncharacterized protein
MAVRLQEPEAYAPEAAAYRLLPMRFERLDDTRVVATNLVGEYVVLPRPELDDFVHGRLPPGGSRYRELKRLHFLVDDRSDVALDLLALKVRTKAEPIAEFTGLHMFVVTLRCDHSCAYCQVSRQTTDKSRFDMSLDHATKAVDLVFKSPSNAIKIEFQGGEPLLNFEVIRHVVKLAEARNKIEKRHLQFVIATNLSQLSDEILSFAEAHGVIFSTSLDGPKDLHDGNRPRPGRNSHELALAGIERIRRRLGVDSVSALMTTTPRAMGRVREIIDEYLRLGFRSIFLRPISPYGFAVRSKLADAYNVDEWLSFYFEGLDYILELNAAGIPLREEYTSIVLEKILTPFGTRYVDLQSPSGLGISALVYNYDGKVYASDEARMLAEMNDETFLLGHVDTHSWEDIFASDSLLNVLATTVNEAVPMCTDCAFLPYCGSDPAYHRAIQGDVVGHKAKSSFCRRNMSVFKHLVRKLEDHSAHATVLRRWVAR